MGASVDAQLDFVEAFLDLFPNIGPSSLPLGWSGQPALLQRAICTGRSPGVLQLFAPCVTGQYSQAPTNAPLLLALAQFTESTIDIVQRQVRCLLRLGADVEVQTASGETPLDIAAGLRLGS